MLKFNTDQLEIQLNAKNVIVEMDESIREIQVEESDGITCEMSDGKLIIKQKLRKINKDDKKNRKKRKIFGNFVNISVNIGSDNVITSDNDVYTIDDNNEDLYIKVPKYLHKLNIYTSVGDIACKRLDVKECTIKTSVGNVNVEINNLISNYCINTSTSVGNVQMKQEGTAERPQDEKYRLDVGTSVGDLNVTFKV